MWIAAFSEAAGLRVGTVRLVAAIRAGQALGMSLAEIKSLVDERRKGGSNHGEMLQTMMDQRERLGQRAAEVAAMIQFVDAKIL